MSETHIPKDLEECFIELRNFLNCEDIAEITRGKQEDMVLHHHGLGRHLRNEWKLWLDSPLSKWFNEQGIYHADDMSGIILDSFWRHLNNEPLMIKEQIKQYQDYWEKMKEEKDETI